MKRIDVGNRMTQGIVSNGVVYLSGQVGAGDSVSEQTLSCLQRIDALLERAGSSREKILKAEIWLSDMAFYEEFNAVWDGWFSEVPPPTRACGEMRLAFEHLKVEIIIVAAH